jgi:Domain of unknown function (DUF4290)
MIESRGPLRLREYGRNVQNIVSYIKSKESKEERTRLSTQLIELMKQINPNFSDSQDNNQKLWDHLFIISDFTLDVDSPFPEPTPSTVNRKPKKLPYTKKDMRYRVYGHNVELLVQKTLEIEDPEKRKFAEIYLARLMKTLFYNWNKESVDDEVLAQQLSEMSEGKIKLDVDEARENGYLEMNFKPSNQQSGRPQNKGRRNFRKRRY